MALSLSLAAPAGWAQGAAAATRAAIQAAVNKAALQLTHNLGQQTARLEQMPNPVAVTRTADAMKAIGDALLTFDALLK